MTNAIQLIVGLANPGAEYAKTRHNAGAWLVEKVADKYTQTLRAENKFLGMCGKIQIDHSDCRLLIPTTYMNRSGKAVIAMANFYRIPAQSILVVHDDLDLPTGVMRFKQGGGDGGHNGLKDISAHLGKDYWRLRIGIGHPGQRDKVHDYVLSCPSKQDREKIYSIIDNALDVLPDFIRGKQQHAIQLLHSQTIN